MMALDRGWEWDRFEGSASALKWNRRDLPGLADAIKHVRYRRAAVQAGGNLGIYPKALARVFEHVYTFEPAPDLFAIMGRNAPERNIIRFQAALGEARGFVGLSRKRRDGKPDNHEGITHVTGRGPFPTLRIDDFGFRELDLMCLDVEGYEFFALRGAVDTITACRPVIAIELNKHSESYGYTHDQIRAWLTGIDYRYVSSWQSDEIFIPSERTAA